MGYQSALEAAGAEIHAFEEFGMYEGTWLAYVTYNGESGWAIGYFGSCSLCDAFEGEIGDLIYDDDITEEEIRQRTEEFGRGYLEDLSTTVSLLEYYRSQAEWDIDAEGALAFVEAVARIHEPDEYREKHEEGGEA